MIDSLGNRAERLCRLLAPVDLGDAPLYIVRQSQLPDELGGKSICGGFTAPRLDLYLLSVIGPAWRGRGPCMVVNDTDYTDTMDAIDVENDFFSVVVHELANILERPRRIEPAPNPDAGYLQFEALCLGHSVAREMTETEEAFAFVGHGKNFLRIVLHLQYRAQQAGIWLTPFRLCGYRIFDLSHANRYREALGDEPQRMTRASFQEILAIPEPSRFLRLWTDDLEHRSILRSTPKEAN